VSSEESIAKAANGFPGREHKFLQMRNGNLEIDVKKTAIKQTSD
jgi:hypothetical protein